MSGREVYKECEEKEKRRAKKRKRKKNIMRVKEFKKKIVQKLNLISCHYLE